MRKKWVNADFFSFLWIWASGSHCWWQNFHMLFPLICCGSWSWCVYLTDLLHVGWRSAGILYSFVFTIFILFPHSLEGSIAKLVQFHPSESTTQNTMFSSVLSCLFSESSRETGWHWAWLMQDLKVRGLVISLWAVVCLVLHFYVWEKRGNEDIRTNHPCFTDFMLIGKNRQRVFAFCHTELMAAISFLEVISPNKIM